MTCPRLYTASIVQAYQLARFAKDGGTWPVAGGTLDQTRWFLDFCQVAWSDESALEAERFERAAKGRR